MARRTSTNPADPVADTSEKVVIGGILDDPSLLGVVNNLMVDDFHTSTHQLLYALFLELDAEQTPIDENIITSVLQERGQLEQLPGGTAYLYEIRDGNVATASHLQHHARIIVNAKRLRNFRRIGAALEEQSREAGADHVLITEKYRDLFDKVAAGYDLDGNLTPVIPHSLRRRADIVCLADIEEKETEWLWKPRIPLSMLSLLTGDPSAGKTYLALAIAAGLSHGRIPYSGEECEPCTTLYLTLENSGPQVLRPRFRLLGGKAERFHLLRGSITGRDEDDRAERGTLYLSDVALLEEALERTGAKFVAIDPMQSFLGADINMNLANETRPILDGLTRLAEKHNCAILLVRHRPKSRQGRAIYSGIGSIDFSGAARSELLAGTAPDDQQRKRALTHIQSNVGPMGAPVGYDIDVDGHFDWTATDLTTADILADESGPEERAAVKEAKEFLRDTLSKGPLASKKITKDAKDAGISDYALRQAKYKLKVHSDKSPEKDGGWTWALPDDKK